METKDLKSRYKSLLDPEGKRAPLEQMEGESDEDFAMWQDVERELAAEDLHEALGDPIMRKGKIKNQPRPKRVRSPKRKPNDYGNTEDDMYTAEMELNAEGKSEYDLVTEGTWSSPEDDMDAYEEFFSEPRLIKDIDNWLGILSKFAGDDDLFDELEDLKGDSEFDDNDARGAVRSYLQESKAKLQEGFERYTSFNEMGKRIGNKYANIIIEKAKLEYENAPNTSLDVEGTTSHTSEEEFDEEAEDYIMDIAFEYADAFIKGFSDSWLFPLK